MTTIRLYKCNFCGVETETEKMHGLYWTSLWSNTRLEERAVLDCENHLCECCLNSITMVGNSRVVESDSDE